MDFLKVDKVKNMRIIVGLLPTKADLTLQSFSRSVASIPNDIYSKLGLLSLPSLVFNKKFTISEWASKYIFCPPRKRTRIVAIESCRAKH